MQPSPHVESIASQTQAIQPGTEITIKLTPFDRKEYRALIEARDQTLRRIVKRLKPALGLSTAADAGCGLGFFTETLAECGLSARGFDARAENIEEARRRFPRIPFEQADVEAREISQLGQFDLALCFGLLYHLENPLQAIRNLRAITEKCLVLESMCLPEERCSLLLRQEPRQDDQSLTELACYPSESSLVKMLYRAGFSKVYRVTPLPDHDDFRETSDHTQRRTVLLASQMPIDVAGFRLVLEPVETQDPWVKNPPPSRSLSQRIGRFLASPMRNKYVTLANRARRIFPGMPIPLRLPCGVWWLAEEGILDQKLLFGEFETMERRFVKRLLRRDMTVVDVGAHHGLYTLLASKCVGWHGRVVAIEPSPRERARLEKHLGLNRSSNVELIPCAAGEDPGQAELYVVERFNDVCNSLRFPDTPEPVKTQQVQVRRLDDILSELDISKVDFMKLDAEGAELSVLYGATKLLNRSPRPAMLVEVQDVRTKPWGYAAREILQFLMRVDYQWFAIAAKGALLPIPCNLETYDANLVALPIERTEEFLSLLGQK